MKIDKAIEKMKNSVEVIKDKPVKKIGRPPVITEKKREEILRAAEELFHIRAIAGEVGISVDTIERHLKKEENKDFALAFAYAQNRYIAYHQRLMMQYAKDKREKDWRAEKYILTIADREYSERKYLTEAVANQDAKIMMLIKAEQLTLATKRGKEMLKTVANTDIQGKEDIDLLPFKPEDPKNKGKAKKVKNKGESIHRP